MVRNDRQVPMAKLRPDGRARVIAALIAASATVIAALIGVARWERVDVTIPQATDQHIGESFWTRARGRPIGGVRVSVDALPAPRVAYTDKEGVFVISVPANSVDTDVRMRFLMKGYEPYDRVVTPAGGRLEEVRMVRSR